MVLRSPDELVMVARQAMIDGREPTTTRDRMLVLNFIAYNIHPDELVMVALPLFPKMYGWADISSETCTMIATRQLADKKMTNQLAGE